MACHPKNSDIQDSPPAEPTGRAEKNATFEPPSVGVVVGGVVVGGGEHDEKESRLCRQLHRITSNEIE